MRMFLTYGERDHPIFVSSESSVFPMRCLCRIVCTSRNDEIEELSLQLLYFCIRDSAANRNDVWWEYGKQDEVKGQVTAYERNRKKNRGIVSI